MKWRKLRADMAAIRGRLILVVLALATGLLATITISSAFVILTGEIRANYMNTNPASGILDIGAVDQALLERVRGAEGIAAAEALSILESRVRYENGNWDRALIFVSPNPLEQQISRLGLEVGAATPGAVLLERRALDFFGGMIGDDIALEIPGAGIVKALISGTVFDPSLAPAEQEQAVYVYIDQATYHALGGVEKFEMIRALVAGDPTDQANNDTVLGSVANDLRADGVNVHLVQIPPAGQHPHEGPMRGVLMMFLVFGILAFVLSALLVSVTVEGLMASQMRQIAIMKTIGARGRQIAILYLAGMLALAGATLVIAVPIGIMAGRRLSAAIAQLLNFNINDAGISPALIFAWISIGLLVPTGFALLPVRRAAKATIVSALSDPGVSRRAGRSRLVQATSAIFGGSAQVLLALRGAFRRRNRTLLIVMLLSIAGAVFITARTVALSYQTSVDVAARERLHDVALTLGSPAPGHVLDQIIQADPRIQSASYLITAEAALARSDGLAIVRTYPDGGHGSVTMVAAKTAPGLHHHVVLQGELPPAELDRKLVLNLGAQRLLGNPAIGDTVRIAIDGPVLELPLAAVIRQYLTPATAYAGQADVSRTIGTTAPNLVHLTITPSDRQTVADVVRGFETRATAEGVIVVKAFAEHQMDQAIRGHVRILIVLLFALGVMMAFVGFFGLTTAQSISVSERAREFGIMRAIGGLRRQILGTVFVEGMAIGLVSLPLAVLFSLPISALVTNIVGRISFGLALPFSVDMPGIAEWALITLIGTQLASIPPALNASRQSVRETLVQI